MKGFIESKEYQLVDTKIYTYENGERILLDQNDLRGKQFRDILVVESFKKIEPGSNPFAVSEANENEGK